MDRVIFLLINQVWGFYHYLHQSGVLASNSYLTDTNTYFTHEAELFPLNIS